MRVGIVGAGFAGLAAAIAFRNQGHDVTVFEKSPGLSTGGGAISLAQNALTCLSILGIREHFSTRRWADVPATIRSADGRVLVRSTLPRLTGGTEYATVPRGQLLEWLAEQLPTECLHYSSTVTNVDPDGSLHFTDGTDRFDLVVGADGAHGLVRRTLWQSAPVARPIATTNWAWLVNHDLHEGFGTIWGCTTQFGILPLNDGRTYVYGGTSQQGADLDSFQDWPAPLPELISAANPQQIVRPRIFEARPPRRLIHGKVALIGDAAHTMQPTFGQGAALAMEDALTLAYRGARALSQRRPRVLTLYAMSKAGAYFSTPQIAALENVRNVALRITPDSVFNSVAGSVGHWRPFTHP